MKIIPENFLNILFNRGFSKQSLKAKIEQKSQLYKNYLDKDVLKFLILKENDIDYQLHIEEIEAEKDIPIKEINEKMNNIQTFGKIIDFSTIKTYKNKSNTDSVQGYYSYFLLEYEGYSIKVLLFSQVAFFVETEECKIGNMVRITNARPKKHKNSIDLFLSEFSSIQINPKLRGDYLGNSETNNKLRISDIHLTNSYISIMGIIRLLFDERTYKNGSGRLIKIILQDSTGEIPIIFFNDKVDMIKGYKSGDILRITSLMPKQQYNNDKLLELQSTSNTTINLIKESNHMFISPISEALEKESDFNIECLISNIEPIRNVSKSEEPLFLRKILLRSGDLYINLNFWGDNAKKYGYLQENDKIRLIRIKSKHNNYTNKNELHFQNYSEILKIN